MADAHTNFALSAVLSPPMPANSGTSLTVSSGHGARFPAPPFNATVWPAGGTPDPTTAEIVRVTGRAIDTFTVIRGTENSTPRMVVLGDQIAATITVKTLTDVEVPHPYIFTGV